MSLMLVRKQNVDPVTGDRFKVTLNGSHTTKQKIAMLLQAKFFLHEQGIDNAGITDVYFPLIDPHGYPITNFRDGSTISGYDLIVENPYHCAADEYDRRRVPPLRFTPC